MCTYVIVLNWNGWKDTIECLESVLRLENTDLRVVVCDNGSEDGSREKIKEWSQGGLLAQSTYPELSRLTSPPISKPIRLVELTRAQAESENADFDARLVLIQTGANLGFARGNNVGIRYALRDPACKFLWLLNNDTVVEPGALSALLARAVEHERIGAVGSVCYYAHAPSTVQAWAGARVNLWIGVGRNSTVPRRDDWFHALYGASMLISRAAIEDAGLLDEGFFLNWEETELCIRLRKKGWRLAAASSSRILHKVNASTGGNSLILDRYFTASGLRILRIHSPAPHFAMLFFLSLRFAKRLSRLEFSRCGSVWAGAQDYRRMPPITPGMQCEYPQGRCTAERTHG